MWRASLLVVLLAPALVFGRGATRGLAWPPDDDLYRDIAQAQTMADGALLADPFYAGETLWYNPLVPGMVAGLAGLAGVPVHAMYTQAGAFLNLLAPLLFFLLIEALFGLPAAALATLHLMYVRDPVGPPWLSPSYSPWLYSSAFTQALFYASLLGYRRALATGAALSFLLAGLLFGLTFLGHTAPALLLATVLASSLVADLSAGRGGASLRNHLLLAVAAAMTAAPLLWSVLGRYRLRILNPAPLDWVWAPLTLPGLAGFVAEHVSIPATALALAALAWLVGRDPRRREARLLATWALATAGLLALALLRDATGIGPRLVPRHHFVFYWRAAESALLGYGAAVVLARVAPSLTAGRRGPAILLAAVALVVAVALPSWRDRDAFLAGRRQAERDDSRLNRQEARDWIRARTAPGDVFLAADDLALVVVAPAGRKTVALAAYFSSPYVDWASRHDARDRLVRDLREGQADAFVAEARPLGVTFVIHKRSDRWAPDDAGFLQREFQNARIGIYRVLPPAPSQ